MFVICDRIFQSSLPDTYLVGMAVATGDKGLFLEGCLIVVP